MSVQSRAELSKAKRLVVKVGSSSITGSNEGQLEDLVAALSKAHARGTEVVLVSSGAIATGMPLAGFTNKPDDLPTSQALAAIGQSRLIARYQASLERFDIVAAQVLLTAGDLEVAETSENAARAMERLLSLRVLPIVNENDTVATHEIRFGDNDRLAALVAVLVKADALVLLSDVDALYDMPPSLPGASRIENVAFGQSLDHVQVDGAGTGVGTGGAITKLGAAQLATEAGVAVLLTSAKNVSNALEDASIGTFFEANPSR